MSSLHDLEDPSQPCIYLAPRDDLTDEGRDAASDPDPPSSPSPRDISEGYLLRLQAYKEAWSKCLERVQTIVRQLHTPVVSSVVSHIYEAYDESHVVPGLPYPEIPVVGVSLSGGSSILEDIFEELDNTQTNKPSQRKKGKGRMVEDPDTDMIDGTPSPRPRPQTHIVRISPSECSNLASAMKAIVGGFVNRIEREDDDHDDEEETHMKAPRRKPTASLANYDINLLAAWYKSIEPLSDDRKLLLVVMHDFEQFDRVVMQDVFDICSQHVPRVPLVFLLALSSPSVLTYIRGAFTRATLTLLRIDSVSAPSGADVLETVLSKTFFDPDFDPDVMLGPATLDYLVEFGTRHTASIDTMLTILQLAYMKHFEEPFTILVHDAFLGTSSMQAAIKKLEQPLSFNFLDALLTRLWTDVTDQPTLDPIRLDNEESPTIEGLLDAVSAARSLAHKQARKMRIGFQTMCLVKQFMHAQGYKTTTGRPEETSLELMTRVVRGRVSKEVKYLGMMVKKVNGRQLRLLLQALHQFFHHLKSPSVRREEEDARIRIVAAIAQLPEEDGDGTEENTSFAQIAAGIGDWLTEYIESRLVRLDQGPLWDVWNTGMTPFPSELINPAPRLAIVNALLHPYEVLSAHRELFGDAAAAEDAEDAQIPVERQYAIWELPDTSILFRRYMDSGRMINVYDWFEAFAGVLDVQREQLQEREKAKARAKPAIPKKGKGKGKVKQKVIQEEEDAEEKWKMEVQARFMRALQELDFMGFIKHTGRKADHVMKTIYDIPD